MRTLLLSREDVARHVEALSLLEVLRDAHRAHARRSRSEAPVGAVDIRWAPGGDEPGRSDRLQLHDRTSGALLAVMDVGALILLRQGLIGALSADVLARPEATRVALLGARPLSSVALKSLRLVRSLNHVRVYDPDPAAAFTFAQRMYHALAVPVRAAETLEEAVADADIVLAALPSTAQPVLFPGMLPNGCHVSALGPEAAPDPQLSAALIRQSRFFCDDRVQAVSDGPLGRVGLSEIHIAAELGEVLDGQRPGRQSAEEITLFAGSGLAEETRSAAWLVYEGAREDDAIERVEFDA